MIDFSKIRKFKKQNVCMHKQSQKLLTMQALQLVIVVFSISVDN